MAGVLLLHGISRTARSMKPLERALRAQGFAVCNLDYPSRRGSLEQLADGAAAAVARFAAGLDGPLHIVTHSMGGLVARVLIARHRPARLGRVVMLAPPNGGSEIADMLHRLFLFRWWFGPSGAQLVTRRSAALRDLLGSVNFELGVIAGNRSLYPLASVALPKPHDGRVSVAATRMAGMRDHLTLPVSHTLIMRDATAIAQTLAFLRTGRFDAPPR
jgi:pimeloyl-ACP methyl ester carboxylesterase